MFNASSPIWDGSLAKVVKSKNLTSRKNSGQSLKKDIQSTNNILYWNNNCDRSMANKAKNKLQLIDAISHYHKQRQGQIGQTNNTQTKSTKAQKHLL